MIQVGPIRIFHDAFCWNFWKDLFPLEINSGSGVASSHIFLHTDRLSLRTGESNRILTILTESLPCLTFAFFWTFPWYKSVNSIMTFKKWSTLKKKKLAWWLRLLLPIQGAWVQSLIKELKSQNIKQKQYCNKFSEDLKKKMVHIKK